MDLTISSMGISTNRLIAMATGGLAGPRRSSTSTEPQQVEQTTSSQPFGKSELTEEEKRQVEQLKERDAETRRHEQAHKAAAGAYAKGGATYEYETGPDGKQYAVGGEVKIDVSPVEGDLDATIEKMQQVQRAARAPAQPSTTDQRVAAKAAMIERRARTEKNQQESSVSQDENGQDQNVDDVTSGEQDPAASAIGSGAQTEGSTSLSGGGADEATASGSNAADPTGPRQIFATEYGLTGIAALAASPREAGYSLLNTNAQKTNPTNFASSLSALFEPSSSSTPGHFIDVRV